MDFLTQNSFCFCWGMENILTLLGWWGWMNPQRGWRRELSNFAQLLPARCEIKLLGTDPEYIWIMGEKACWGSWEEGQKNKDGRKTEKPCMCLCGCTYSYSDMSLNSTSMVLKRQTKPLISFPLNYISSSDVVSYLFFSVRGEVYQGSNSGLHSVEQPFH